MLSSVGIYHAVFFVSIFLGLYTYIFYPFALLIYGKIRRRKKVENNGYIPYVSIIVAAYNEEKTIEEKINNVLEMDYPKGKIEILIGSDGSEDSTDKICQKFSDVVRFRRIEPRQGKANVLNTLVPLAKGEIILFSDANTILNPDSLKRLVTHFADNSIGAVCGRLFLNSKEGALESFERIYWRYDSYIKFLESKISSIIGLNGGIYAIRKELFENIPNDTIVDDLWISINILEKGAKIHFEETAIAYEYVSENIVDEFWRKVRIGAGNLQIFIRKPVIANQNSFIQIAYYSHKLIRWVVPFLLISIYVSALALSSIPGFLIIFYLFNLTILIALIGTLLEIRNKLVNLITYFILFNFALLFGYIRYLSGKQSVLWRRAER